MRSILFRPFVAAFAVAALTTGCSTTATDATDAAVPVEATPSPDATATETAPNTPTASESELAAPVEVELPDSDTTDLAAGRYTFVHADGDVTVTLPDVRVVSGGYFGLGGAGLSLYDDDTWLAGIAPVVHTVEHDPDGDGFMYAEPPAPTVTAMTDWISSSAPWHHEFSDVEVTSVGDYDAVAATIAATFGFAQHQNHKAFSYLFRTHVYEDEGKHAVLGTDIGHPERVWLVATDDGWWAAQFALGEDGEPLVDVDAVLADLSVDTTS